MLFKSALLTAAALLSCAKSESTATIHVPATPNYPVIQDGSGHSYHTGLRQKPAHLKGLGETHTILADCGNLPDEFDLRTLGVVPSIKDQGQCGSCWAFSKTASLESALLGTGKPYLNLSEQELVSNDKAQWGCQGGLLDSFNYQINHGQGLEADFPYTARDTAARSIAVAARGTSFAYIGTASRGPTEKELKCALYKSHTIPWITVSASNAWSNPPKSESTLYTRCGHGQTNHAVGVVGWNKSGGFIMRNSWGTSWGDKGYMSLKLGCDTFGEEAAYIMVAGSLPCKPPVFKLPAEISAEADADVLMGVKAQDGVVYQWYKNGVAMDGFTSATTIVTAEATDAVYKVVGKNSCGQTESSVKVKLATNK